MDVKLELEGASCSAMRGLGAAWQKELSPEDSCWTHSTQWDMSHGCKEGSNSLAKRLPGIPPLHLTTTKLGFHFALT